jgi:hypothetical protein
LRTRYVLRTRALVLVINCYQIALQIMSLASTQSAILVNNPYFVHVPLLLVGQFFLLTGVQSPDFQKVREIQYRCCIL